MLLETFNKKIPVKKKLDFFKKHDTFLKVPFQINHHSSADHHHIMKSTTSPLFKKSAKLAVTCMSLVGFQLTSAHAQWDYEYLGSELASSPWQVPPIGQTFTVIGDSIVTDPGTLLEILSGTEWNPGVDYTLEFEMAVTDQGPTNGQGLWSFAGVNGNFQFLLNQGGVKLNDISYVYSGNGIDGSVTNTYRLVVDNKVGALYINNTEVLSNIAALTSNPTLTPLWVGDWGAGIDGEGTWDSIRWNNTTVIPEPSAAVLLLGALAVGLLLRRRRA